MKRIESDSVFRLREAEPFYALETGEPSRCKNRRKGMERTQAGKDLVMAGYMALSASAALARLEHDRLAKRLPAELLRETERCGAQAAEAMSRIPAWLGRRAEREEPDLAWLALGEGGVLGGLWQMAVRWRTGFTVYQRELPVRQETIEICELLEINPYCLRSEGCFLIASGNGGRLCEGLREQGCPAAVIGRLEEGKDKRLLRGETSGCLNRPQEDEWDRFLRERSAVPGLLLERE